MASDRSEDTAKPQPIELAPGGGTLPATPTEGKGSDDPREARRALPRDVFRPTTDPGEQSTVEEATDGPARSAH